MSDELTKQAHNLLTSGQVSVSHSGGSSLWVNVGEFEVTGTSTYHPDGEFVSWRCTCGECDYNPSLHLKPEFRTYKMCAHATAVSLIWGGK